MTTSCYSADDTTRKHDDSPLIHIDEREGPIQGRIRSVQKGCQRLKVRLCIWNPNRLRFFIVPLAPANFNRLRIHRISERRIHSEANSTAVLTTLNTGQEGSQMVSGLKG